MPLFYRTEGSTNAELLKCLQQQGTLHSSRIRDVLLSVDRANYCPDHPYVDSPQPIGWEQTISAPHMHVMCLEELESHLQPGAKVLDVGSGSGILCTAFGKMVADQGKVIGIDIYPELVEQSIENVKKDHPELLEKGVVEIKTGDGWKGDPENAPYDVIHVAAGAESLPQDLVRQLKKGGRMVRNCFCCFAVTHSQVAKIIPVGPNDAFQVLEQVDKSKGNLSFMSERENTFVKFNTHAHTHTHTHTQRKKTSLPFFLLCSQNPSNKCTYCKR